MDEHLKRSDIRLDPSTGRTTAGAPFDLRLVVSQVTATGACAPLHGAQVDIWHCDAAGVYSDVRDRSFDTMGQKFTSQLYFADELTDRVHAREPYWARRGQRLLNSRDMTFRHGGAQLILPVVEAGAGFTATYSIAVRPGA